MDFSSGTKIIKCVSYMHTSTKEEPENMAINNLTFELAVQYMEVFFLIL